MKALIFPLGEKRPVIHETAYVAPGAVICGDVELKAGATVWYGCVLRGDENKIVIGEGATLYDGVVVHADNPDLGGQPAIIEAGAMVGHRAMIHGATIAQDANIGAGATILDGAVVEQGATVAPKGFLSPRKKVPARELWAGAPARKRAELSGDEDRLSLIEANP